MTQTTDLATWLTTRLADVESAARAATPGPWRYNPRKYWRLPGTMIMGEAVFAGPAGDAAIRIADTGEVDDPQSMSDAAHIAAWDPATVLRMVAGARKLLELHRRYGDSATHLTYPQAADTCIACGPGDNWEAQEGECPWPCPSLQAIAEMWGWTE